jgi:glutamine amidotransferase
MLRKTGHDSQITKDPEDLKGADKIILPGVGAFDSAMKQLGTSGILSILNERVLGDLVPILGICLGMQLFAKSSEEGLIPGLGWIDGHVMAFDNSKFKKPLKIPHMGWNNLTVEKKHPLLQGIPEPMRFYFVHSYHFVCNEPKDILASAQYGYQFEVGVQKSNIMGVQFHPEKSHKFGMQLLKNFAEDC